MPPPVGTPPSQDDKTRPQPGSFTCITRKRTMSLIFLCFPCQLSGPVPEWTLYPSQGPRQDAASFPTVSRGRLSSLSYAPKKLTTKRLTPGRCARKSQGEACFRGYPWIDSNKTGMRLRD